MKRKCQEILKKHNEGEKLNDREFTFVLNLLHSHPHYFEKVKFGILDIIVRKNIKTERGIVIPYQFRIIGKDNREIPFSFYKCIDNYDIKKDIIKSFRMAIQDDIINFKLKHIQQKGVADHKIPFQKLLNDFLKQEGLEIENINIIFPTFGLPRLKDVELKKRWVTYHREHAILRIIPKEENLKKIKFDKQVIRGEVNG